MKKEFNIIYLDYIKNPNDPIQISKIEKIFYDLAKRVSTNRLISSQINPSDFRDDIIQEMVLHAWNKRFMYDVSKIQGENSTPYSYFSNVMLNWARTQFNKNDIKFKSDHFSLYENDIIWSIMPEGYQKDDFDIELALDAKKENIDCEINQKEYLKWLKKIVFNLTIILSRHDELGIFLKRHLNNYLDNFRTNGMTDREFFRLLELFPPEALEVIDLDLEISKFKKFNGEDERIDKLNDFIKTSDSIKEQVSLQGKYIPQYAIDAWNYIVSKDNKAMMSELIIFGDHLKKPEQFIWYGLKRIAKDRGYKIYKDIIGLDKMIRIV